MSGNKNILLVDDSDTLRGRIVKSLEKKNYDVTSCSGGMNAIKLLKQGKEFDLMLLDLEMPDFDGFDVLRMVKGGELAPDLPVLVLTGVYKDPDTIAKLRKFGAAGYINKNTQMKDLHFRINKILSSSD